MGDNEPWVFLAERKPIPKSPPETAGEVIRWWEHRRLKYNRLFFGLFGAGGVVGTALYMIFVKHNGMVPGWDWNCPILLIYVTAAFIYGVFANLCFTGGWISELLIRAVVKHKVDRFGPIAYTVGRAITVLVVLTALIVESIHDFSKGARYP